jgi:serine/threonine-protein kinase
LKPGVAVNIIEKCLRGASALHDKGIVHCDIKPSNIMLDCHGSIRLIDIGSAFQLGAPRKPHAWTPRYAPPEVLENDGWTPQSDLASLGYVLIELLSGWPAFLGPPASPKSVHFLDKESRAAQAKAKHQLFDRLEELIPARARESELLMKLCRKLIHPDPAGRFASAEEAFNWTAKFKDQLVVAGLGMHWVQVIKSWLIDTKRALSPVHSSNGPLNDPLRGCLRSRLESS